MIMLEGGDYKIMTGKKMEIQEKLGKKLGSGLSEKIAVYVPSTYDGNREVDNSAYVQQVMKELAELFGGATAYQASGAWISEEKGLIIENVTIVYAYCDTLTNEAIDDVIKICEHIKEEMKQEAVSIEINNKLYFI